MERDFEVGGLKFKLSKIDAFQQFHIVRRIGPLLAKLLPAMASVAKVKMEGMSEEQKLEQFAAIAQPFMSGLSELSDEEANYVLFRLLSAVEVLQPQFNTWAKIANDTGIMMQNIELPVLLQAAGRSLMYNLSGFFASLPRQG